MSASAHRRLQRLVEDELKKRPKLTFCLRLLEANPRRADETYELWVTRVFEANRQKFEEHFK